MNTKTSCCPLITGLLAIVLGLSLCPSIPAKPVPVSTRAVSASSSSFPWSRSRQQDKAGYYYQPAGLCEDYPAADRTQGRLDKDFHILRSAGVKLLRVGISWTDVENEKGRYDWLFWDRLVATAAQNHVTLIPYVCYTPEWAAARKENFWKQLPADPEQFGAFMRVIAARYRGRVHSWELWNEPDNPDFLLADAAGYARLVEAGAQGVRLADPTDAIVLGGLADGDSAFGRALLRQYHVGRNVSAVNFHGYDETWNRNPLEDYSREVRGLSAVVRSSVPRPDVWPDVWMAEFGYSDLQPPAYGGGGEAPDVYDYQHTTAYQAAALFKSHVLALSTGRLSLTAWYRINDLPATTNVIGDAENRFLGVVNVHGRPKPAFFALKLYNALFGQPVRCRDDVVKCTLSVSTPAFKSQIELHFFEQKSGKIVVVGWLRSPVPEEVPSARASVRDTRLEEVSLMLPARAYPAAEARRTGGSRGVTAYALNGDRVPTQARLVGRLLSHIRLTGAQPFIATVDLSQATKKE